MYYRKLVTDTRWLFERPASGAARSGSEVRADAVRRRLHAVVRLGVYHSPLDSDTRVVFPDARSTTPR